MRFDEWLDAEPGRLGLVADHFEVTKSAVSQWRINGVPIRKIPALHELTGKQVSLEELLARPRAAARDDDLPSNRAVA